MMKVSDPIIFGHAVKVFFKDVFAKHGALLAELGVNVNNGFGNLLEAIQNCPTRSVPRSRPTFKRRTRTCRTWQW